ncbi:WD40-repeat-containing domain protein [Radiomyces spectabilis]|uniref:WD40-repeat-containing domain protein n=1 Tax=Radiomyces spectabilis TaxID=64574 RepID=UPI00221F3423|nr:WD40-repeat-containing domain protein [Radiomyces spectabilis]KAI8367669.1 WD40-repeat-containing domain protein [Radiomyces spectabilis]
MNLSHMSNKELVFLNFNQDFNCIAVGTKNGYRLYNCDPFGKCYSKSGEGTSIVEMLFCTSLVALVGTAEQKSFSQRHLKIINTKRQSTICELTFPTPILAVKMNRRRLIVVLEEKIFIYDISNMKLLYTLDTAPNPLAICSLSPSSENCYIAYPSRNVTDSSYTYRQQTSASSHITGDVEIFDALDLRIVGIVQAHKSHVSCITINADGTLLATSSEKGTVIRVFSIPDGAKIYQFRRGSYPAKIYSIAFNLVSTLLCVSSDTETVHIFKLSAGGSPNVNGTDGYSENSQDYEEPQPHSDSRSRSSSVGQMLRRSSMNIGRNIAGSVGSYLPESLTEMWEPARDFASLKLPSTGVRSLVALSSTTPQVMVVTSEGFFYQYSIDLENGGDCVLQNQLSLLEPTDELEEFNGE